MTDTAKDASALAATTGSDEVVVVHSTSSGSGSGGKSPTCSAPEFVENNNNNTTSPSAHNTMDRPAGRSEQRKRERFGYLMTKDFWIVLLIGQILALCLTGTNTFTTLLVMEGTSIPAFQTFFNYVLLNLIYTSYTLYKYGVRGWARLIWKDGWKYIILSFCDVEGNYFTVLAYRYTTILSAQLINFWAIVVVVTVSFLFLRVRYHWAQILGILTCIGGMGILLASDHIQGVNGGDISSGNQLKGDLFALAGATFYGLSNVAEEFLVSKRPLYEVIGQIGWWGMIINGAQAGIFDRDGFKNAVWNGKVGGYLTGYTLILSLFYTLVPILYRLASAAFFNISLLTSNFWGVIIGLRVFGYTVHFLYPIAFVLILIGQFVYFLGKGVFGEAKKAWLGEDQEKGVLGIGTAKRKIQKGNGGLRGTDGLRQGVEHGSAGVV